MRLWGKCDWGVVLSASKGLAVKGCEVLRNWFYDAKKLLLQSFYDAKKVQRDTGVDGKVWRYQGYFDCPTLRCGIFFDKKWSVIMGW